MSVTLTIDSVDVIAIAPELSNALLTQDDWDRQIAWAADEMSPSLGAQLRLDRCGSFLVAHLMSQLLEARKGSGSNGGAAGPIASATVGKVSQSFVASDAWKGSSIAAAQLQTTRYGREYLRLIRIYIGPAAAVAGGNGPIGPSSGWPNS